MDLVVEHLLVEVHRCRFSFFPTRFSGCPTSSSAGMMPPYEAQGELQRVNLPRTWVNEGKKKGRRSYAPAPLMRLRFCVKTSWGPRRLQDPTHFLGTPQPERTRTAGEGMPISSGIMCWCTRTQSHRPWQAFSCSPHTTSLVVGYLDNQPKGRSPAKLGLRTISLMGSSPPDPVLSGAPACGPPAPLASSAHGPPAPRA